MVSIFVKLFWPCQPDGKKGYAYFSTSIINTYGYDGECESTNQSVKHITNNFWKIAVTTQLYSVPPWAAAFGFSLFTAYFSDRLRHRFAFTVVTICIAIAGLAILLNVHNHQHVQYGALFLVTSGIHYLFSKLVWGNN
jgi:hypothetical protein